MVGNVTPKKKFGQNFLVNLQAQQRVRAVMEKIAKMNPELSIVEVGPGQGDLTQFLLEFGNKVVALEIDEEAVTSLKQSFSEILGNSERFELHQTDALNEFIQPHSSFLPAHFMLLANLPFNVGSRILMDVPLAYPNTPLAVILQQEVAMKAAKKSDFTFFGTWLNLFWKFSAPISLAPNSFFPQPRVYCTVLVGEPKTIPSWLNQSYKVRQHARTILKTLFAHPRKTLASNLKSLYWSGEIIENFLQNNGYTKQTRLTWDNYELILEQATTVDLAKDSL